MLFDPTHGAFHVVACGVVLFMVWIVLLFMTQFVVVHVALLECDSEQVPPLLSF